VKLFFDKESGLLVKAEYRLQSPEQGKEVGEEIFYRDYTDINGFKAPGKVVIHRDGEKFVEAENYEMKFPERLDASVFAKPE
jgi:hypothetical protein